MRDLFRFLYRVRETLLFLVLMVVSLGMVVNGNTHQRAQAISSSNAVIGRIYTWKDDVTRFTDLVDVNRQLADENAAWRNRDVKSYVPLKSRFVVVNDSLYEQNYRYFSARTVNSTISKQKNHLTLDRGLKAGVRPGMGVIGSNGIVGIVDDSRAHFSSVMSVLNTDFSASVMLKNTRHFGLIKWDTSDPTTASVVDMAKHVIVAVGDTVVTSGLGGVFPEGVQVGVVTAMEDDPGSNYHSITIRLAEDMTRSAYVYVVMDLLKMERDSLEAKVQQERP